MKIRAIIMVSLIMISCKTLQEIDCPSKFESKGFYINAGLRPIELLPEKNVYRIWIDGSSSLIEVLTIVIDSTGNYAEFVRMGYYYKKKFLAETKKVGHFKKVETCPSQGWDSFLISLNKINLLEFQSRINNPSIDGIIMGHPMTHYLIEVKNIDEVNKFKFFSFYPSQNFPADMIEYENIEKLVLTSFPPLYQKLKDDQQLYKYRFKDEY